MSLGRRGPGMVSDLGILLHESIAGERNEQGAWHGKMGRGLSHVAPEGKAKIGE